MFEKVKTEREVNIISQQIDSKIVSSLLKIQLSIFFLRGVRFFFSFPTKSLSFSRSLYLNLYLAVHYDENIYANEMLLFFFLIPIRLESMARQHHWVRRFVCVYMCVDERAWKTRYS